MDFNGFFDCFIDVVWGCAAVEVDCYRVLPRGDGYEWRCREKCCVFDKVFNAKGSGHDDKSQRLYIPV